ncbi:bifunctional riboflavin biosynthesis protein RIBA 1, chloroplastic-like protein [Tanacetum coccineum]
MMSYAFHMMFIALLIGSGLPSSPPSASHTTSPAPSQNGVILNEVAIGSFVVSCLAVVFSLYRKKTDKIAKRMSSANLPTAWGSFVTYCYKSMSDGLEHVAMVKGEIGDGMDVLVRVHSECLTGDIFKSTRCDCGNQLALAMQQIEEAGRGVVVYLKGHEGRGIGLGSKLRAYNLQDDGRDTVQANEDLGLPVDSRDYGVGAQILKDLGVRTIKLMTNNPAKCDGLKGYGLQITDRVPVITPITKHNKRYLETKGTRMGHVYGIETESVIS